jgi:hypothetical protein
VPPRTSPRHNISTIVITMPRSLQAGTDTGCGDAVKVVPRPIESR